MSQSAPGETPAEEPSGAPASVTLFLAGDVMTGRGIDQILPHPGHPAIREQYVKSALDYVELAIRANGPIQKPVQFDYIWGEALAELSRRKLTARIVNLETAITRSNEAESKGINYRMSPDNIGVLSSEGIDCCVLSNNHSIDWGVPGLLETLEVLQRAGIRIAGAGFDLMTASSPAILEGADNARVLIFGFACADSGVPKSWAADTCHPGVNFIGELSRRSAAKIGEEIATFTRPEDIVIVSIHWGGNWGYDVPDEQIRFAHALLDLARVHVVYGHSSHHAKSIEVYKGKLILYGCGDLINDYEGISGNEEFHPDLSLMYFPSIRMQDGQLEALELVPQQIRNMRLNNAKRSDAEWIARTLSREGERFATRLECGGDNRLVLRW